MFPLQPYLHRAQHRTQRSGQRGLMVAVVLMPQSDIMSKHVDGMARVALNLSREGEMFVECHSVRAPVHGRVF